MTLATLMNALKKKKEKEIAENDGQIDKEISKNSRQIIDGGAPLRTIFWNGKIFVDTFRANLFYMKVNLTHAQLRLMEMKKILQKIMHMQEWK